jgi:hypothetical protein
MLDDFKPVKKARRKIARLAEPKHENDEPKEMEFKTPEQVAAEDIARSEAFGKERRAKNQKPTATPKHRFSLPPFSKKQYLLALGVFSVLATGSVAAWTMTHRRPADTSPPLPKTIYIAPPKTHEPSRLTGVEIPIALNKLPTTAVQIENSPDARPQSGLYDAGIVTEAIAEGGITRFNAIYMESQPGRIGPIRSLRPYYIDFFWPYDAAIAHAGGSGQALAEVVSLKLKDIDHGPNAGTFYRDSNRFAPHNLYSSRAKLLETQRARGYGTSTFSGLVRKAEKKAEKPTARAVDINISSFLYNPRFEYHAKTNSYLRSQAGKPHMDENGKQINPKVVIVLVMPHHYAGIYSVYQTTGSGTAFIFQDGIVTKGIWEKPARNAQFRFGDANGSPIGLNPGQTWMTLATAADRVTITP